MCAPDNALVRDPRVSIIIPCYNAAPWVAEAIESCLAQTYGNIEIIVIDDGSTDGSLEIIQSYCERIIYETGPHRGRCYARNRGFALSRGDYTQYLDADDYLAAGKIERQVGLLEATSADAVYGDWTYWRMLSDGSSSLSDVEVAGAPEDLVEALLAGWWIVPHALLYRRTTVERSNGWDARVEGVEDSLFLIEIALGGATICYQPGSFSLYRRYGSTVHLTSNHAPFALRVKVHYAIVEGLHRSQRGRPNDWSILARNFYHLARECYDRDRPLYHALREKARQLDPSVRPTASWRYTAVSRIVGYAVADGIASHKRKLLRRFRSASW